MRYSSVRPLLVACLLATVSGVANATRDIEVRVEDSGGTPIANANVCLGFSPNDSSEGFRSTNASGIALFAGMPIGSRIYTVTVKSPNLTGAVRSFDPADNPNGAAQPPWMETVSLPGDSPDAVCNDGGQMMMGGDQLIPRAAVRQALIDSCIDALCFEDLLGPELSKRRCQRVQPFCFALAYALFRASSQDAIDTFNQTLGVFRHDRCTQCHTDAVIPSGHTPTIQGRNIGPGDCATCHNRNNRPQSGAQAPVPLVNSNRMWHMAPGNMALDATMSANEICTQVKAQSGGNPGNVADHVLNDDLVKWAFTPECGSGLSGVGSCGSSHPAAPGTHQAFANLLRNWADNGGACPP